MRQQGHEAHERHARKAESLIAKVFRNEDSEGRANRLAEAQVHATLAIYEALIMQRAGYGPSVAEMASDS